MKQCYERHECGVPMLQMVAHRRLEERRPFRYVRLGQPLRWKAPDHVSRMLCVPHYPWEPKGRNGNLQNVKAVRGCRGRQKCGCKPISSPRTRSDRSKACQVTYGQAA